MIVIKGLKTFIKNIGKQFFVEKSRRFRFAAPPQRAILVDFATTLFDAVSITGQSSGFLFFVATHMKKLAVIAANQTSPCS